MNRSEILAKIASASAYAASSVRWILLLSTSLFVAHMVRMCPGVGFQSGAHIALLTTVLEVGIGAIVSLALCGVHAILARGAGWFENSNSAVQRYLTQRIELRKPSSWPLVALPVAAVVLSLWARSFTSGAITAAGIWFVAAFRHPRVLDWKFAQFGFMIVLIPVIVGNALGFSWTDSEALGRCWYGIRRQGSIDDQRLRLVREVVGGPGERDSGMVEEEGAIDRAAVVGDVEGRLDGDRFSFLILGDPGEGDASQFVLKDRLTAMAGDGAAGRPAFMVILSDVIYPDGALGDYEKKFYIPLKGISSELPVIAIPGNHDWYNPRLEGFVANFFTPEAANRVLKKPGVSVEDPVGFAAGLRARYRVSTGRQRLPFFRVATDDFLLLGVDTGLLKSVDAVQKAWLVRQLASAGSRFKMVLLGHPIYDGGSRSQAAGLLELDEILGRYGVHAVMAGDTHNFQFHEVKRGPEAAVPVVRHFVNGGGGAYMVSTRDYPSEDAAVAAGVHAFTHYPSAAASALKISQETSRWWAVPQRLASWAMHRWRYDLSAFFRFDEGPFHQSFVKVEVRRDRTRGLLTVTVAPYGVDGPLRVRDFQPSKTLSGAPDSEVRFQMTHARHRP